MTLVTFFFGFSILPFVYLLPCVYRATKAEEARATHLGILTLIVFACTAAIAWSAPLFKPASNITTAITFAVEFPLAVLAVYMSILTGVAMATKRRVDYWGASAISIAREMAGPGILAGLLGLSWLVTRFVPLGHPGSYWQIYRNGVFVAVCSSIAGAIIEEAFFRGFVYQYLVDRLEGKSWSEHAAVFMSALVFSFSHSNAEHPFAKYVQVFPIGVALGYGFRRLGFFRVTAIHAVFNLAVPHIVTLAA